MVDVPNVPQNVQNFIEKSAQIIGDFEADLFKSHLEQNFFNLDNSPIEQLLYVSISAIAHVWNQFFVSKIAVHPQKYIGEYRVDFLITYSKEINGKEKVLNGIIVECDSQKFHERSEQERRYEKKRDRFFLNEGYKVFHYTGKEIIHGPFVVAHDAIKGLAGSDWEAYELVKIDAETISANTV